MSLSNLSLPLLLLLLISYFFDVSRSQFFPDPPVCHPHDVKVLLRIKRHLGDPPWLSTWDPSVGCGQLWRVWNGVEWDDKGRVMTVSFSGDDIHVFPPFLDRLPALRNLNIYDMPRLTASVPSYIGNLSHLDTLYIKNVKLSGPYPDSLARLTSLKRIFISSTGLRSMPNFIENLTDLTYLDLSNNKLTGPIPSSWIRLTNLQYLVLNGNSLSGSIPSFLGKRLVNLTTLNLDTNKFSGTIPTSLGQLANLESLSLENNRLSGPVPTSLGHGHIDVIRLGNNKLAGDASFLIDLSNNGSTEADISTNRFKFDLTNVEFAPSLYAFNISHNMIYGRLPKLFYLLRGVLGIRIDITYNDLCGPIPNGRRLKHVDPSVFAHNKCLCGGPLPPCK